MTSLRPMPVRMVFKALKAAGFQMVRQKGSHTIWNHSDGRSTVVPVHPGEPIGKGLLRKIISDMELTVDEFYELIE
jgi:predicted RNA binding protein YcfA (HicA-like mRNA interferase family)